MELLIYLIIINSIWTLGLTVASQEDMILSKWAKKWENEKWAMPVITCVLCMPSLHSVFAYGFAAGMGLITEFSWRLVFMLPLVITGASVLNCIVWSLITLIMKKNEYYEGLDLNNFDPNDEREIDDEPKESYYVKRN